LGTTAPSLTRLARRGENAVAGAVLLAMVVLPLVEMVMRRFNDVGIPGALNVVRHLTLWVALLGAALAARDDRLLSMGTVGFISKPAAKRAARILTSAVAAGVSALLTRGALDMVLVEVRAGGSVVSHIPVWVAMTVIPGAFAVIALRLVWLADERRVGRLIAGAGLATGIVLGQVSAALQGLSPWIAVLAMVAVAALGMPIFAAIGGAAALLFLGAGVPLAALPAATYEMTTSPTLAAIPLFTLAGCLLAEGDVSRRLLRLFRAWIGWLPGGTAVVLALIFAFFTVFTGGSGVTILALGGLGLQALQGDGYRQRFSLGLLTGSASLGLLLPPALPIILYGIVAGVAIPDLFVAGIVPGFLLIGLTAGWAIFEGVRHGAPRSRWNGREAVDALVDAGWDLLLPVIVLVAVFGGFATLIEAAAITAAYAFVLQVVIHRTVSVRRDVPRAVVEGVTLIGGVLVILAVAMGLTGFLVDARVPTLALAWLRERIASPLAFLLLVNVFLLAVGCMMDIFSATVVVAPLLVPLGLAYGVDPVHLGIIFIANLELGYLTPPVGLNLFLASYRFERPFAEVARSVVPLLLIYAVGVVLITYVPALTTGVVALFR
jgi:C4-dicarboxylate transporter DctM subunit